MGEAMKEIKQDLDERYEVGVKLLHHMSETQSLSGGSTNSTIPWKTAREINIPRYRVRCELPRLLENGSGIDDD